MFYAVWLISVVFDNWRVLHGRSAFEGLRRICGGYSETFPAPSDTYPNADNSTVNRDDFISRFKTSNFPSDQVIAANMQLK